MISYAPGNLPGILMTLSDVTIGPTFSVTKSTTLAPTAGTLPINQSAVYPSYNVIGKYADAGEVADCLNQLVARIEALEAILGANPNYGIIPT